MSKTITIHLPSDTTGRLITNNKDEDLNILTEEARCQPCSPPSEGTSLDCVICKPLNLHSEGTCCRTSNLQQESVSGQPSNQPQENVSGQPLNLSQESVLGQPSNLPVWQPYDVMQAHLTTDNLSPSLSLNEDEFLV